MDLGQILKDAALIGLAVGVFAMAAAMLYFFARNLRAQGTAAAVAAGAEIAAIPFGFTIT